MKSKYDIGTSDTGSHWVVLPGDWVRVDGRIAQVHDLGQYQDYLGRWCTKSAPVHVTPYTVDEQVRIGCWVVLAESEQIAYVAQSAHGKFRCDWPSSKGSPIQFWYDPALLTVVRWA